MFNYRLDVGDNKAIVDILNNPRYEGAISSIKSVTQILDTVFVAFISLIAFFIISSALLKNVIAGAYAAFPKLFDAVNEVKANARDKLKGKGPKGVGSFAAFLINLLPDFKELSDFRDDNIEPRDYFLKAIPQMFAVVMIGVVIYNGYYRDITVKVADLGSELIHRFIVNVDPVEVWDEMTNSIGAPTLSSKADQTPKGKFVYSLAEKMYSDTVSFYTDVQGTTAKNKLSSSIENWCYQTAGSFASGANYFDGAKWSVSYQENRIAGVPSLNARNTDSEQVTKQYSVRIKDFGIDSAKHQDADWYYVITITAQKVHNGASSIATCDVSMTTGSWQGNTGAKTVSINTMGSDYWSIQSNTASCAINNDGSRHKMEFTGGRIVIHDINSLSNGSTASNVTGVYYQCNGASHAVTSIKFSNGGSKCTFSYKDTDGSSKTFTEGTQPAG